MNLTALLTALVLCLGLATLGNAFVGRSLTEWYVHLRQPRWAAPLPLFVLVAVAVYLAEGVILYRLLDARPAGWVSALVALLATMVGNEVWNLVFFGRRSARAGFVGLVWFCLPLATALVLLARADPFSAGLLAPYALWVVYDLAWMHRVWRLNSD